MDYPEVSICIPVYERNEFLYLTLSNIKRQTYPHNKLTVIIDECKTSETIFTPYKINS
jgi:glycosyltransferase involved in cell wall biosynthesis